MRALVEAGAGSEAGRSGRRPLPDGALLVGLVAAGAALQWLTIAYPAQMPAFAPWQFSWVEYLAFVLPVAWYLRGVARLAPSQRPHPIRQVCFWSGLVLCWAVLETRLAYLAQHMFALTQAQQFVLHDLGPSLLAVAWPGRVLLRGMPEAAARFCRRVARSRLLAVLQWPPLALALFVGLLAGSLAPVVVFRVMLSPWLYALMNWTMLADGLLFWCLVLDPRPRPLARIGYGWRMALIAASMMPVMPLGAWLAFSDHPIYISYDLCGRLFPSVGAVRDQQLGGLIVWVLSGLMSGICFLLPLNAMRLAEEAEDATPGLHAARRTIDASAWTGR